MTQRPAPQGALQYTVSLHNVPGASQSEEALTVHYADGTSETMRLHEYERIYRVPGLYELVVQEMLECQSPDMLARSLVNWASGHRLRALDLGAGVGVVGEKLYSAGVSVLVGSDCLESARMAAKRDRPGLYKQYLIDDGSDEAVKDVFRAVALYELNVLACAGAIDDDHISLERLSATWKIFPPGAWIALAGSTNDFRDMEPADTLSLLDSDTTLVGADKFRHRMRMDGTAADGYHMIVGQKL